MQITNVKIGTRLALSFAAICTMLVLLSGFSIMMLGKVNTSTDHIVNDRMPKIALSNALLTNINDIAIGLRNMMLTENVEDRRKQQEAIMAHRQAAASNLGELDRSLRLPRARELLAQMNEANSKYVSRQDELIKMIHAGPPSRPRSS